MESNTFVHKPYFDIIQDFITSVLEDIGKNNIHHGLFIRAEHCVQVEKEVEAFLQFKDYDCRIYDSLTPRNKAVLEKITSSTTATAQSSVYSLLCQKKKPIVILLKDIDGLAILEKGVMNMLGKLLRSKRTQKQLKEPVSQFPVICIGTFNDDKKTRTLEAGCMTILVEDADCKIKKQIRIKKKTGKAASGAGKVDSDDEDESNSNSVNDETGENEGGEDKAIVEIEPAVSDSNPAKDCVARLFGGNRIYSTFEHLHCIPSSIRTSVGLIVHENLPDILRKRDKSPYALNSDEYIELYFKCLRSISESDKIDRRGFQKQMPVFNEISSLLKSLRVQMLLKQNIGFSISVKPIPEKMEAVKSCSLTATPIIEESPIPISIPIPIVKKKRGRPRKTPLPVPVEPVDNTPVQKKEVAVGEQLLTASPNSQKIEPETHPDIENPYVINPSDLAFTKALTKFSTQNNNEQFIERVGSLLMLDTKDTIDFMEDILQTVPPKISNSSNNSEVIQLGTLGISKLDIPRLKKMLS